MTLFTRKVTDRTVLKVLIAGFLLVLLILSITALAGIRSLHLIRDNANNLLDELRFSSGVAAQIQHQLDSLNAITQRLAKSPESIDNETITSMIHETERNIEQMADLGIGKPEEEHWRELENASKAFSEAVRRSLNRENAPIAVTRLLLQRHHELIAISTDLVSSSYRRAVEAQTQIDRQSQRLIRDTLYIMAVCFIVAVALAFLTLRMTVRLMSRMEKQANELSRVSWHLLENQESAARRFSHELHDELGQSLTAVKANLSPLIASGEIEQSRLRDSVALLDESIQNVREMSQLLHPRILDDFGLDPALQSLSERLSERTNIRIEYESNFKKRLPLDVTTHLYRIAQEALTNAVKHSKATTMRVRLWRKTDQVSLLIGDNGIGLPGTSVGDGRSKGLGLIAMGARARHLGGELRLGKGPSGGLWIEIKVPVRGGLNDETDTDTAC